MYTCLASVVNPGDLIEYISQNGVLKAGRITGIKHYTYRKVVNFIIFTFDNGLKYFVKKDAQVTILEMSNPGSLAKTRNNPNNWKMLGIEEVVKPEIEQLSPCNQK